MYIVLQMQFTYRLIRQKKFQNFSKFRLLDLRFLSGGSNECCIVYGYFLSDYANTKCPLAVPMLADESTRHVGGEENLAYL